MLVTVNSVVEIIEHGLHGSGKLHVKVEVIGRKGNDEKCGAGKRHFFTTVQSLDILHFLLSITNIGGDFINCFRIIIRSAEEFVVNIDFPMTSGLHYLNFMNIRSHT